MNIFTPLSRARNAQVIRSVISSTLTFTCLDACANWLHCLLIYYFSIIAELMSLIMVILHPQNGTCNFPQSCGSASLWLSYLYKVFHASVLFLSCANYFLEFLSKRIRRNILSYLLRIDVYVELFNGI